MAEGELIAPEKARRLEEALDAVRICDPAVGSGAFLLGAMQEIVQLRRGLAVAAGQFDTDISVQVAEWKRRAIQWSLYGVDNNPEAVEICHLRLWLSLVLDLDSAMDVDPLPNLDFRVVAGDSLIDRIGGIVLPESLPVSGYQPPLEIGGRVTQDRSLIDRWKREFEAEHENPRRLRELRNKIVGAVQRILLTYVEAELQREHQAIDAPDPHDLHTAQERHRKGRKYLAARQRVKLLERARTDLQSERRFWKPFLWPILFQEAFQDGGFDVVLANPPYVRMERLDNEDEALWKEIFPEVAGSRADILVYFYGRAVQIARDGGWIAFITSNKFMRSGFGMGLREHLPKHLELRTIVDLGDLPLFDSGGKPIAVLPAVLVGRRNAAAADHMFEVADLAWPVRRVLESEGKRTSADAVRESLTDLQELVRANAIHNYPQKLLGKEVWTLEDPKLMRLFERLMSQGTPLGEYAQGQIYRGIVTGLNKAFVVDQNIRDALVESNPCCAEVIKPWLRGRDIKRWRPEWTGLHILFMNRGVPIERYPAVRDYLESFRARLEQRATAHLHPWYELQQPQEGIFCRI